MYRGKQIAGTAGPELGLGSGQAGHCLKRMAWSQSWAGAGPGWANIYFFLSGHGGGKRFKVWEGCTFLAEVRRTKNWQARRGRLLVGPGRAGLGRGQAEANEDDPEWPGWAAPVVFFAGYGKSQLMAQRHIYI